MCIRDREKIENAVSFIVKATEYYIELGDLIDVDAEIAALEKDLAYAKGFLENVMKKLNNERFVAGAPADVLEKERNKKHDAEAKITAIQERLKSFKK